MSLCGELGRAWESLWDATNVGRYFEGGTSSVYLWDTDDGFAGCVLLKKGMSAFLFLAVHLLI